jgi:predicted phage tail protein
MLIKYPIIGSGGKGGGGGEEDADSLKSKALIRIVELVCEGEIEGFVYRDGSGNLVTLDPATQGYTDFGRCVFFDDVRVKNLGSDTYNFTLAQYAYTLGSQVQTALLSVTPGVESVKDVSRLVRHDYGESQSPIATVSDVNFSEVIVSVKVQPLFSTDKETGDVKGSTVVYQIHTQLNGGGWTPSYGYAITGKTRSYYSRSHKIPLPAGYETFAVKVVRITPDSTDLTIQDNLYFSYMTEVSNVMLSYPNSVMVGLSLDSSKLTAVPRRAYHIRGLKVRIPSNYNPLTRTYTGLWDGTGLEAGNSTVAWTDNPAWIYYDLLTNHRYGTGAYISESNIDKWALYEIAQYCDELVDDGFGGHEPRFTCNCLINTRTDAYEVFKNLASTFRGMVFWSRGTITAVQDRDYGTTCALFTRANVVDGRFTYRGTARKARHTVALVTWDDPSDMFRRKVEYVEDQAGVAELGINQIEVNAFACTSQGQAHRVGKWILLTELNEVETVEFKTGLDASFVRPGHVISISDPLRLASRMGGRIQEVTAGAIGGQNYLDITLDAPVTLLAGKTYEIYSINPASDLKATEGTAQTTALNDVVMTATLAASTAEINQVGVPISVVRVPAHPEDGHFVETPKVNNVWILACLETVVPQSFRVLAVSEVENNQIGVVALEHIATKYAAIEDGLALEEQPTFSLPNPVTVLPPTEIAVVAEYDVTEMGLKRKLSVSWVHSLDLFKTHYVVELRYNNSNWLLAGQTSDNTIELEVKFATEYSVRVHTVNTLGYQSEYESTTFNLSSTILADSVVTGLEIFGQGNDNIFEGRDPKFSWRWNSPDTAGDLSTGYIHPLFRAFVVQILNAARKVVREEFVTEPTFTYSYEKNVFDNVTPLREFTIRIAVLDKTNHISLAKELTVNNEPPQLGDVSLIQKTTAGGNLILNFAAPVDPDFAGILVFASKTENYVTESNLLKADGVTLVDRALQYFDPAAVETDTTGLLAHSGYSTSIVLPLSANTYYITIAPYDAFGITGLYFYELGASTISTTVDLTPPSNTDIAAAITSFLVVDTVTIKATLTLTDVDSDLGTIKWGFRKTGGPFTEIFGTVVARDESGPLASVVIEWIGEALTGYAFRFAAIDTSGNQAVWQSEVTYTTLADVTAPAKPTNVAIAGSLKSVFLSWINPPDTDFSHVAIYQQIGGIPPHTVGWDHADYIASVYGSSASLTGKTTGYTYSYWICAVDKSGNPSIIRKSDCVFVGSVTLGQIGSSDVGSIFADAIQSGNITAAEISLSSGIDENGVATGTVFKAGLATEFLVGSGIWLGVSSTGVPQFRIGDPEAAYFSWDSSTYSLVLKGYLKIGESSSLLQDTSDGVGLYLGASRMGFMSSSTIWTTYFDASGDFVLNSGGNARGEGEITWDANAQVKTLKVYGYIDATKGGNIGGFTITRPTDLTGSMYRVISGTATFASYLTPYYLAITGTAGENIYFSLGNHFAFSEENGTVICKIAGLNVYANPNLEINTGGNYRSKLWIGTKQAFLDPDTLFFLGHYIHNSYGETIRFSIGDSFSYYKDTTHRVFHVGDAIVTAGGTYLSYSSITGGANSLTLRTASENCLMVGSGSAMFGVTYTGTPSTSGIWLGATSMVEAQNTGKFYVTCEGVLGANTVFANSIIAGNVNDTHIVVGAVTDWNSFGFPAAPVVWHQDDLTVADQTYDPDFIGGTATDVYNTSAYPVKASIYGANAQIFVNLKLAGSWPTGYINLCNLRVTMYRVCVSPASTVAVSTQWWSHGEADNTQYRHRIKNMAVEGANFVFQDRVGSAATELWYYYIVKVIVGGVAGSNFSFTLPASTSTLVISWTKR